MCSGEGKEWRRGLYRPEECLDTDAGPGARPPHAAAHRTQGRVPWALPGHGYW